LEDCLKLLKNGSLPPWKVEDHLAAEGGVAPPENFRTAALCRQAHIEDLTGEPFRHIRVPEKPYKILWRCDRDHLIWELDARDGVRTCSLCGEPLKDLNRNAPLVANYVGGEEVYYSYAGRIQVRGDVATTFTNLLVYGTGLGPIGVTRGCHVINLLGGAEVSVEERARAVRCHGLVFASKTARNRARILIEENMARIQEAMRPLLEEFSGDIRAVEFDQIDTGNGFILYVEFTADFVNFRGHGDISRAVGTAKQVIESVLTSQGLEYELSVIAQGHDGDLKPSPKNKRGRRVSAEIRVPVGDFEDTLKLPPDRFLAFVEVDALGADRLGCQFYSGMGGEIIPAVYKATQVNPQSPLVSAFQNTSAGIDRGDVVYRVELPNVEVGIASCREGIISPVGREALRIMGVNTAREFAVSLAAQVLAGEFNLALEISRQKLYASPQ
jgi:hypothetical protein